MNRLRSRMSSHMERTFCRSTVNTPKCVFFFFFNDTATTEIYTLSLHDALPIWQGLRGQARRDLHSEAVVAQEHVADAGHQDRKSTRLNSSHSQISYAVFCLKKKIQTLETVPSLIIREILPTTCLGSVACADLYV